MFGRRQSNSQGGSQGAAIDEGLKYCHEESDPRDNAATSLPEGEEVLLECIWAFEVYLPPHFASLSAGFEKLGWDVSGFGGLFPHDALAWTIAARRSASGASLLNLGPIVRPGTKSWPHHRCAPLPDGVAYAFGELLQPAPSMTVMAVQFVLEDDAQREPAGELRRPRSTVLERSTTGGVYLGPYHQKQRAIDALRNGLADRCTAWFREHLPGAFSGLHQSFAFPTAEFWSLKKAEPFAESSAEQPNRWMSVLGIEGEADVWREPKEHQGVALKIPESSWDSTNRIVLAANKPGVLSSHDAESRVERDASLPRWLGSLTPTLMRWAIAVLATSQEKLLAHVRDTVVNQPTATVDKDAIETELSHLMSSTPYLLSDLLRLCGDKRLFMFNTYEFERTYRGDSAPTPLFESIREGLLQRTKQLQALSIGLADALRIASAQRSARVTEALTRRNLHLQRWIAALTVVMLLAVLVQVYLALRPQPVAEAPAAVHALPH